MSDTTQTVIVTGSSSGIGLDVARSFLKDGANVVLNGRDPEKLAAVAAELRAMGCYEISLGDTIGTGTPAKARAMVEAVAERVPVRRLALHFHDTYGQALANLLAVMEKGMAVIDSSVGGLGGCPYANGAAGNVATEDVVYMLDGLGVETGVDLDAVIAAAWFVCDALGRRPASKVALALEGRVRKSA